MTHKKLWIPGPTEVEETVLQQQARPLIGHRPKEFTELYGSVLSKLHEFFGTNPENHFITVTTSSGTMWMDMVARCVVKKKALACVNGAFSKRVAQVVEACGKEVDTLDIEWGKAIKPEMIREKLQTGEYDTVTLCHNETSTGLRNPINEIGAMLRDEFPDVFLAIDSVSGMVGDLLEPEKLGADVLYASTQKCFALPPGLAIGIVSKRTIDRAREISGRGFYTDIVAIHDYYQKKKQTIATPNISLLYALEHRLVQLLKETPQGVYKRHKEMAEFTRKWAIDKGFAIFAEQGYESVSVTTVDNTLGKDVGALNAELAKRDIMIANGYGALKDKTFRIGHMGSHTMTELNELLENINQIWEL